MVNPLLKRAVLQGGGDEEGGRNGGRLDCGAGMERGTDFIEIRVGNNFGQRTL